jgi:hypothetical protein
MTLKGVIKGLIALAIILAGAAIGWAIAASTNPNNTTSTAVVAASNPGSAVPTNTPLPTFTPAFAGTPGASTSAAARTGGANRGQSTGQAGQAAGQNPQVQTTGQAGQNPPAQTTQQAGQTPQAQTTGQAGQGQRARPITGTVESYDATTKILTVKDAEGKSQKFAVGTATLTKSEKIDTTEFGKLIGNNGIVTLTGEKGSDGVYNARSLTVVDTSSVARGTGTGTGTTGSAPTGGGFPGGGAAGASGAVIIRNGSLADNKLSGSNFNGETITANISADTALLKQVAGSLDDLKAGVTVSVTASAAQGDAPAEARLIALT